MSRLACSLALLACFLKPSAAEPLTAEEAHRILSLFGAKHSSPDLTNRYAANADAAQFGKALFFDPRLSGSGRVSCSTCHDPSLEWTDGLALARGEAQTIRNTPTLWNVADRRWYFWDGRVATLWSQALKPIESPAEMNGNRSAVVALIANDKKFSSLYRAAFGEPPSGSVDDAFANVGKAIAAFETTLVARNSPFDSFLACLHRQQPADCRQINGAALSGLRLFAGRAGCANCHHGRDLTDEEFHDVLLPEFETSHTDSGRARGIVDVKADPFGPASPFSDCPTSARATLLKALRNSPDMDHSYRTPSLRQVALTAPYMHNGVYPDLSAVLRHYSTLSDACFERRRDHRALRVPAHADKRKHWLPGCIALSLLRSVRVSVLELGTCLILLDVRQSASADDKADNGCFLGFGRSSSSGHFIHMFIVTLGTRAFVNKHISVDGAPVWRGPTIPNRRSGG
jgi:cytochrome c peroxidase